MLRTVEVVRSAAAVAGALALGVLVSGTARALDVTTTNGGVMMSIPENYSAKLETGTVNGGISVDFPVPGLDQDPSRRGRQSKQVAVNLGSGGPLVRAMTTNGGVRIKRTNTEQ